MHPPRELFNIRVVFGNIEHLLHACIPQDDVVDRIVLPPPEPSCVEGKLQTISACLHLFALDCGAQLRNDDHQVRNQRAKQQQVQQVGLGFRKEREARR